MIHADGGALIFLAMVLLGCGALKNNADREREERREDERRKRETGGQP